MNQLYLIATPIGNIEDITLRARRTIERLGVFFVEDTREFAKLLGLLGISSEGKKIFSYASHNLKEGTDRVVGFLERGEDVGILCDRGTPGISDPGAHVVSEARRKDFGVLPIPGVSSVSTLMSVSGLTHGHFTFCAFFPSTDKERREWVRRARESQVPLIFFESPQRIRDTIGWLQKEDPKGRIFVGREMTKKFEEYYWKNLADLDVESLPDMGEYSLIFEGSDPKTGAEDLVKKMIESRLLSEKAWAKEVGEVLGVASGTIYNELQRMKRERGNANGQ